ncbi:porin [Verminephrobacter aporrectodeae subsp. tuberculatae]|uniref:porin n=1 Tax=Verminephrobacter aporrectodeae TaxID=1110389 RepID=UPI002243DD73|nr:porin [Verminephrobacter aporrectodeae]MCW8163902.1 porin [Verminephrobacter aporrectodeae subsp. tuberculatae]MCW8168136.1 porin [Verminephrobacter aporrectodeae subsp. tuberculatae]
MNKILALVAGALAGVTAHAQSNATLYGRMDSGLGNGNGGYYEGRKSKGFSEILGGGVTPVWGIRGKEDLGGGLSASYALEWAIVNQGAGSARLSIVGLGSNWGQIDLGRMQTLANTTLGEYDLGWSPNRGGAFSLAGVTGVNQKILTSIRARQSDQIRFISPNMGGVTIRGSYVFKGDRGFTQENRNVDNLFSVAGTYKKEKLSIGLAHESKLDNTLGSSNAWGTGVRYDFGSFVAAATYFDNHYDSDGKGYGLSVLVPIGALNVGLQYAWNRGAIVDKRSVKPAVVGFFSNYYLSKRTSLYFNAGRMNEDARIYQTAGRRGSWATGITHNF